MLHYCMKNEAYKFSYQQHKEPLLATLKQQW